jgi:hypothetical protein
MKYIIVQSAHQSVPVAILFHHIIAHDSFNYNVENIISAGFCFIDKDSNVQVFGKSDSLGKKSREDKDPKIIRETIRPRKEYEEIDNSCNVIDK